MGKNCNLLNIEFYSEIVYGDNNKYIKTKVKVYRDKINTNFHNKGILNEITSYKCLPFIMLECVIRMHKKYYPQTLLKECKYKIKESKMVNYINDDFDPSSSDGSDNNESDGSDNEEPND